MKNSVFIFFFLFALVCSISTCMGPVEAEDGPVDLIGTWRGTLYNAISDTQSIAELTVSSQEGIRFEGEALIDSVTYTMSGPLQQRQVTASLTAYIPEYDTEIQIDATGKLLRDDYITGTWNDNGSYLGFSDGGQFNFTKDK